MSPAEQQRHPAALLLGESLPSVQLNGVALTRLPSLGCWCLTCANPTGELLWAGGCLKPVVLLSPGSPAAWSLRVSRGRRGVCAPARESSGGLIDRTGGPCRLHGQPGDLRPRHRLGADESAGSRPPSRIYGLTVRPGPRAPGGPSACSCLGTTAFTAVVLGPGCTSNPLGSFKNSDLRIMPWPNCCQSTPGHFRCGRGTVVPHLWY